MILNIKKTKRLSYIIEFAKESDLLALLKFISKQSFYNALSFKIFVIHEKYKVLCKVPKSKDVIIPQIEEFGFIRRLNSYEKAYIEEYGKNINLSF